MMKTHTRRGSGGRDWRGIQGEGGAVIVLVLLQVNEANQQICYHCYHCSSIMQIPQESPLGPPNVETYKKGNSGKHSSFSLAKLMHYKATTWDMWMGLPRKSRKTSSWDFFDYLPNRQWLLSCSCFSGWGPFDFPEVYPSAQMVANREEIWFTFPGEDDFSCINHH